MWDTVRNTHCENGEGMHLSRRSIYICMTKAIDQGIIISSKFTIMTLAMDVLPELPGHGISSLCSAIVFLSSNNCSLICTVYKQVIK